MGTWTYAVGLWRPFKGKKKSKIQWVLGLMKDVVPLDLGVDNWEVTHGPFLVQMSDFVCLDVPEGTWKKIRR